MKKLLIITVLLAGVIGLRAENKTVKFTVNPPLVCNNCENKVKDNLRFEKGIKNVKPSAQKGEIEVTYDDKKTDVAQIKEGFKKIGYEASVLEAEHCSKACTGQPGAPCCKEQPAAPCCKEQPAAPCCKE